MSQPQDLLWGDVSTASSPTVVNSSAKPTSTTASVGAWTTDYSATNDWLAHQYSLIQNLQTVEEVGLFVGTWNVNGNLPSKDIAPWIRRKFPVGDSQNHDTSHSDSVEQKSLNAKLFPCIWVFCLQEMVDLDAANIVNDEASKKRLTQWEHLLMRTVIDHVQRQQNDKVRKFKFSVLSSRSMVGVAMIILVEDSVKSKVRNHVVEVEKVGTGALDLGNKGGIGMRLELNDMSICFVSSHLAAHRDKVQERNEDFRAIVRKLKFEHEKTSQEELERSGVCSEAIT